MPTDLPRSTVVNAKLADLLAKLKAFRAASRSDIQLHADLLIDALEPPEPETRSGRIGRKLGEAIIRCLRIATWLVIFYASYHFTGKYW